jgi:hypothetical protein
LISFVEVPYGLGNRLEELGFVNSDQLLFGRVAHSLDRSVVLAVKNSQVVTWQFAQQMLPSLRQTRLKQSRKPLGVVHTNKDSIPWAIIHGFFRWLYQPRRSYFSKGCFRPTLQPRREIKSRHRGLGVA